MMLAIALYWGQYKKQAETKRLESGQWFWDL